MKVRCKCGRFMRFHRHELSTRASGGRDEFRCSRCGLTVSVFHRHGLDDEPVAAVLIDTGEALVFDEDTWEWRPRRN